MTHKERIAAIKHATERANHWQRRANSARNTGNADGAAKHEQRAAEYTRRAHDLSVAHRDITQREHRESLAAVRERYERAQAKFNGDGGAHSYHTTTPEQYQELSDELDAAAQALREHPRYPRY